MNVIGIESSCDETSVSIIKNGNIALNDSNNIKTNIDFGILPKLTISDKNAHLDKKIDQDWNKMKPFISSYRIIN